MLWWEQLNFGIITVEGSTAQGLRSLSMTSAAVPTVALPSSDPILIKTQQLITQYFEGKPVDFSQLPLAPQGTDFQKAVWKVLCQIPYGETRSYKWVAEQLGNPNAVRAVGNANGKNPIPIIIPCHRVVQHNGDLGGYTGGLHIKRYLLDLEQGRGHHQQQTLTGLAALPL